MRLAIKQSGNTQVLPSSLKKQLRQSVQLTLIRMKGDPSSEVSLLLTDDKTIQGFNRDFRGMDQATDVLSFSFLDEKNQGVMHEDRDAQTIPLLLGEIIISTERAALQAAEYGHSIEREIVFLTVHGMLHLLGLDHEEEKERIAMEHIQKQIMTVMGI